LRLFIKELFLVFGGTVLWFLWFGNNFLVELFYGSEFAD